jgi:hypothetical protein
MTQNAFAPPLEAPEAEESSGGSRRTALVAGGLAAAVALAGGGYLLLSGGSDTTPTATPASRLGSTVVKRAVAHKPAVKAVPPVVQVPVTSTVPLGRDPFHALYIAPVAGPATGTTPTTTTGSTSTSTSSPPSSGSTTTAPPPAAPKVYKLVLTGVSGSGSNLTATFNVGGKLMVAKVGSVFGPTSELKLLSLTQDAKGVWTATIQVGDSEPVDAPKGQALYVR